MVTRFPTGAQPHKPAVPSPAAAAASAKAVEASPTPAKSDDCKCGGACGKATVPAKG